jgi:hypothetical protein
MTYSQPKNEELTDAEWKELVALKEAINQNPASVHRTSCSFLGCKVRSP